MNSKRIIKTLAIILFVIVISVFIYALFNYQNVKGNISESVARYSFYGIAVISFLLESFPQLIGADFPLIIGGLLGLNIFWVFLIVAISSTVAGMTFYSIGFFWGKKISLLFIEEESYDKFHDLFKRKGKFALTLTALSPIPYIPILAGVFRMHPYDFLLHGPLMRTLRFAAVAYLFVMIFG